MIHTRQDFMQRFSMQPQPSRQRPTQQGLRPAAVLIPIIERDHGLSVILTQRSSKLRHHPGQISFPGGRHDAEDKDLVTTALREAEEEIGLARADVEIIGKLQDYPVISNFLVRPYIGFITPQDHFVRQRSEVADIFEVPLINILHQPNHFVYKLRRFIYPEVYFIPYQQRNIWGATAGMLRELADHLLPEQQQLFRSLN